MISSHPCVEPIMQKQVGEERTDHPALRRPPFSDDEASIHHLHWCLQPSLDVEKHPSTGRMSTHRTHEQIGIDSVENTLDVEIMNPVITPALLPRHPNSIKRRFAGSVSLRVLVEVRLRQRLQMPFDHL